MTTTQKPVRRPKQELSDAFVDGLFSGRDWSVLHALAQEGLARQAFGASTVERFLDRCVEDEHLRRALRELIVSDRSWKRRVAERAPLSAAELAHITGVGEVVREVRRIYGGNDKAAEQFLTHPNRRLGGMAPILVAATEGGAQAVRELLARMEEGAPV
jgi:putative toxin-antitoxin system antitoxin component (TIGR02293 family)